MLTVEREFEAPREHVFEAFTDAERYAGGYRFVPPPQGITGETSG